MEKLFAQQKVTIHLIGRALDNFKKIGKANLTYAIVRNRIQQLREAFAQFRNLHAEILATASKEVMATERYFTEDRFSDCEMAYLAASDYMAEWLSDLEPQRTSSPESSPVSQRNHSFAPRSNFQLPRINLPKFSGEFSEWEAFRDQFTSLIINNSDLSNVHRLQYLHSCLKGEASDVIRNLTLTDANFKVAWKLLTSRYDNKRRLVHEHIHALHTLPQVMYETATALTALHDRANVAIQALRNLGRAVDTWDDVLVYLVAQKFDKSTRRAWELQLGDTIEYPSYEQLEQFLASRIRAFENILPSTSSVKGTKQNTSTVQSHNANTKSFKCPMCQQPHSLSACSDFRNKTSEQRREFAQKFRCCFNCLSVRHVRNACQSTNTCRHCQRKHHTLLHDSARKNSTNESSPCESKPEQTATLNSHLLSKTSFTKSGILLATALIGVSGSNGRRDIFRALLDQGSVTTLITERLAQRLRLPRSRVAISITGIGDAASFAKHAAQITVSSRKGSGPSFLVNALVLKSLTSYLPQRFNEVTNLSYLRKLSLADSDPTSSDPIDVIIGADLYGSLLLSGIRSRSVNEPVAQNSIFGWVLSGPMPSRSTIKYSQVSMHHGTVHEDLHNHLKRFWEIEELPQQTHSSSEEKRCEEHFFSTHSRAPNGQYLVRLPFKTKPPLSLGQSRPSALTMYRRSENRLKAQPQRADEYHAFLRDYETLGHMSKVPPVDNSDNQIVYIPHHAVIREHSATTRLRVVFNASRPTSNGLSLNDHLMIGPKLQTDLPSVLTRWRQYRYVYTSDIAKMYRQILVDPRDVDYQRILWRPTSDSQIEDYCLLTVTYGTASAPYLALRVLQQVATDEGSEFPLAVPIVRQQIYVDDCVFGADDIPLALRTRDQLISLLDKAGFKLRKWASNNSSLLAGIDPTDHGLAHEKTLKLDDHVKILGIKWTPTHDAFEFDVTLSNSIPDTKRAILSTIARIFDPLGWLTPVVIIAKILMQKLWLLKCNWDDVVPNEFQNQWCRYYSQLTSLSQLSIARWTGYGADTCSAEIHGFADASTSAYGAVVYLKIIHFDGTVKISLLCAKSKVAPLKPLSIPRLELCGTVLLARTISFVLPTLEVSKLQYYCWTDSTVALAWLQQEPTKWKSFVANRVHVVQSKLPQAVWQYVPSEQNPADLASRGIDPSKFVDHKLWWEGPSWLKLPSDQWPTQISPALELTPEERTTTLVHLTRSVEEWDLSCKFSSWTKLLRVTAYIMKFTRQLKARSRVKSSNRIQSTDSITLSPEEIRSAREFWLQTIQNQLFHKELPFLKNGQLVAKTSKLIALNPFLDKNGLIRVGGRLRNSLLSNDSKQPIILASHPLVELLIRETHLNALHAGSPYAVNSSSRILDSTSSPNGTLNTVSLR